MPVRERELTRFDFKVNRFLNSEDVDRMTAEEVGCYMLLLCKAWVLGKDCTLPDDPQYLARIGRVEKVSELVMSKFYLVDHEGIRRWRNGVLYEEWQAGLKRSKD